VLYRRYVTRQIEGVFDALSRRDYPSVLSGVAPDVHHAFAGTHALGGQRHSADAMRRWFERLYRLFPDLNFEVRRIVVNGGPSRTTVAVEWIDRATPVDGVPYENEGTHFIEMRRGKVVYIHAYPDTQVVEATLARLTAAGVEEAGAEPITV